MTFLLLFILAATGAGASHQRSNGLLGGQPQVTLDYGTFKGNTNFRGVDSFLGIPFAKAGRLENPVVMSATDKLQDVQDATQYGLSCPQQELVAAVSGQSAALGALLGAIEQVAFAPVLNQGEDCLSINVQMPSGINSTAGLPVMFWIYGGGFELGSSAALGSESTTVQVSDRDCSNRYNQLTSPQYRA